MYDLLIHALVMVFGVVIAGVSQLLLKSAAQRTYKNWIYQYLNIRVILGYGIMVASTLCTVIAYRVLPLSMAPACDAFGQVVVAFLSWLILKEKITRKKLIGLVIMLVGILLFFIGT